MSRGQGRVKNAQPLPLPLKPLPLGVRVKPFPYYPQGQGGWAKWWRVEEGCKGLLILKGLRAVAVCLREKYTYGTCYSSLRSLSHPLMHQVLLDQLTLAELHEHMYSVAPKMGWLEWFP